jgi:hypothetical protein
MDPIVACCGLVCSDCPAYIATQAGDAAALERVAAQWRDEYGSPDATADSVICDGCMVESEQHCYHWHECDIRVCGAERGVANCAHCSDHACDRLESFFDSVPDARTVLDNIHRSL